MSLYKVLDIVGIGFSGSGTRTYCNGQNYFLEFVFVKNSFSLVYFFSERYLHSFYVCSRCNKYISFLVCNKACKVLIFVYITDVFLLQSERPLTIGLSSELQHILFE